MKTRVLLSMVLALAPLSSMADGFDGPYLAATIGAATAEDQGGEHYRANSASDGLSSDNTLDGTLYSLAAGYDKVFENGLLLGLVAEMEGRSGSSGTAYQRENGAVYDVNYKTRSKLSSVFSLRARLGYVVASKALLYATAGYAAARVERTYYDSYPPAEAQAHSTWQNGWTAGIGGEYLCGKNLSAGVEYRYSDYGTDRVDVGLWRGRFYENQKLTDQSLRLSLAYRF